MEVGSCKIQQGFSCLFPTVAMYTEMPTHYAFELFGARRRYKEIKSKQKVSSSVDIFLGDFDYDGPTEYLFDLGGGTPTVGSTVILQNLSLTAQKTESELESRFPGVNDLFKTKLLRVTPADTECIKSFDCSGMNRALIASNCLVANTLGSLVRARYTNFLLCVPREMDSSELSKILKAYLPPKEDPFIGVQIVSEGLQEGVAQAGQFANLYLQGAKETTLTQFLEEHREIIKKALKAEGIFFQPSLRWVSGNPDPDEEAIQPDLIVRRQDGTWWIIDFKLPLLNKTSVTAGGHRRRRFIHTIADGIAQLHNYREYFDYPSNREVAESIFQEEIQDPNLMLVVGSSENVDLTEVNEAKRALKPIDILDYDTLIRLSIANIRALGQLGYWSEAVKADHAAARKASTTPSRSVVSLTRITPSVLAVSTQFPPLASEYVEVRQLSIARTSYR